MKEIKKLVSLWRNKGRASGEVKALTQAHIKVLDQKIKELETIRQTLVHLSKNCRGDNHPHCPIIDSLADDGSGKQ